MCKKMELHSSFAITDSGPPETWVPSQPAISQELPYRHLFSHPRLSWLEGTVYPLGHNAEAHAAAAIFKAASDQNEPVDPEGYGILFQKATKIPLQSTQ